jgi:hypothetical protein
MGSGGQRKEQRGAALPPRRQQQFGQAVCDESGRVYAEGHVGVEVWSGVEESTDAVASDDLLVHGVGLDVCVVEALGRRARTEAAQRRCQSARDLRSQIGALRPAAALFQRLPIRAACRRPLSYFAAVTCPAGSDPAANPTSAGNPASAADTQRLTGLS